MELLEAATHRLHVPGADLVSGDQQIMLLINDAYLFPVDGQFEHRNKVVCHELRCDGAADQVGERLLAVSDVLFKLNATDTVTAAFGLNR